MTATPLTSKDYNLIISGLSRLLLDARQNPQDAAAGYIATEEDINELRDRIAAAADHAAVLLERLQIDARQDTGVGPALAAALDGQHPREENGRFADTPPGILLSDDLGTWLQEHPGVTDVEEVGEGIYGFTFGGQDMSLSVNITGQVGLVDADTADESGATLPMPD